MYGLSLAFMSPVTETPPRGMRNSSGRRPTLALKVTQPGTPSHLFPVRLRLEDYDFITPESRGRQKEKQFALIRQCLSQITARPITGRDQ